MKTEAKQFMDKHQLITENGTVLIGTSGGPDSMALLHLLLSMREQWNLHIIALSVDHQLRGAQSKADVQYVKNMCNQWDVDVVTTSLDVWSYKQEQHVSTQVAARDLRYQFFKEQMDRFAADFLALGHHGDDQIETMFMKMVRSANSSALAGIPVKRPFASGKIIRPLLSVSKAQILSYCEQHHIQPRFDPSNQNTDDTRVWFRKKIIPLIKEKNHSLHKTIHYLSENLYEDEQLLQTQAKNLLERTVHFDENGKYVSFQIAPFQSYAHALQRRVFHLILNYLYDGEIPADMSYEHEHAFFSLLMNDYGTQKIHFPQQLMIGRSYGTTSFYFEEENITKYVNQEIQLPGITVLPDGSRIIAQFISEIDSINKEQYTYICAKKSVSLPLHIRTRKDGDRMSWDGLNGSKKLKDIFIDEKIPRSRRDTWPIVVDDQDNILWLIGIKKGKHVYMAKCSPWIQLHFHKGSKQGWV